MEQLTKIAELLGEDNAKRLKDTITDMIIEQVKSDMDNMTVYLIDFEAVLDGIRRDIERDVRERLANEYVEVLRKMLDDYFAIRPYGMPSIDANTFSKIRQETHPESNLSAKVESLANQEWYIRFMEGKSHHE